MGTKMQNAVSEISLLAHAPPDIDKNAQIIGVCTVSTAEMDPGRYGWMVADFLKWKTLLHGIGPSDNQTWISRLNIGEFMKACGGPYADDATITKQCNDNITVLTNPQLLSEALLAAAQDRARISKERRSPLFIVVCGPVSPDQDICIELVQPIIILTRTTIRDAIHRAVERQNAPHVILMTSSALTAGWVCHPVLCGEERKSLEPKVIMELLARSFGSTFGVGIIDNFTSNKTPFLSTMGRQKFPYYDLMPVGSSPVQVENLHAFHAKVHETLKHRFCSLATEHDFNFADSSSDYWALLTTSRETPLKWWADQWYGKQKMQSAGYTFLGDAFGGSFETQIFHLKYLVNLELHTCRGDWENASTGITRQLFEDFRDKPTSAINEILIKRILNAIEYRASCTALVEMVVRLYSLPLPGEKTCRFWHDQHNGDDTLYKRRQLAFSCLNNLFDNMVLLPGEFHNQFSTVRFQRPYRWLAASLAQAYQAKSDEELEQFIRVGVKKLFEILKDNQVGLLRASNVINQFAKRWLQSITPTYEETDITPFVATKPKTASMLQNNVRSVMVRDQAAPQRDLRLPQQMMPPQHPKKDPNEQGLHSGAFSVKSASADPRRGATKIYGQANDIPRAAEADISTAEKQPGFKELGSEKNREAPKQENTIPIHTSPVSRPQTSKEAPQASPVAGIDHLSGQEFMSKLFEVFSQGGIDINHTMPLVEDFCSKLSQLNSSQVPQHTKVANVLRGGSHDTASTRADTPGTTRSAMNMTKDGELSSGQESQLGKTAFGSPNVVEKPEGRSQDQEKKPKKFSWAEFNTAPNWRD